MGSLFEDPLGKNCAPSVVQFVLFHLRPHQPESTASRPLSEVKQVRVRLVVRFVRTCEVRMLMFFFFFLKKLQSHQPHIRWCSIIYVNHKAPLHMQCRGLNARAGFVSYNHKAPLHKHRRVGGLNAQDFLKSIRYSIAPFGGV